MPLKIAIILNTSWNAFNFRKGLIQHFLSLGHEVVIIAPEDESVDSLIQWGARHQDISLDKGGMNPMKDLKYQQVLKAILKEEKPNIALTYTIKPNIYGSLVCSACRIPVINNVSGLGTTFLWKGWVQRLVTILYQRAFNRSDFIFFQNKDDRALFLQHVKTPISKTGLLPGSGIDLSFYHSHPPLFDRPLKILMIGRLIIDKGVREFLAAAAQLKGEFPDLEFSLAGGYDPVHKRSILEDEFVELKESGTVKYLGQISDIKEAIAAADLIVLPSYREGTPRTLLEGAAMSRPLIATDVPGCREVIDDGINGFLCERESIDSLARKIKLFLSLTTAEKIQMAAASRKLVENRFDESIVIGEYMRKINQLTKT